MEIKRSTWHYKFRKKYFLSQDWENIIEKTNTLTYWFDIFIFIPLCILFHPIIKLLEDKAKFK